MNRMKGSSSVDVQRAAGMPGAGYRAGGTRTARVPELVMREPALDRHRLANFFTAAECGAASLHRALLPVTGATYVSAGPEAG
jgi:hypothetical protein